MLDASAFAKATADKRYSILDAGQWYSVNNDSFAVIPAKAGIQIFVILSEAKDLAVGNED